MGRIGLTELILILLVIILLFGAKRLPELAQSLRKALEEFKSAGKKKDPGEDSENKENA